MSTPKSSKIKAQWIDCQSCGNTISCSDNEKHLKDCPPNSENPTYFYIRNECLFGNLHMMQNAESAAKLRQEELDHLVFLSKSCMQKCAIALGSWTVVRADNLPPILKKAWPTTHKSLTTVHLTKPVLDLYFGEVKKYPNVTVSKLDTEVKLNAQQIILTTKGKHKVTEITQDIQRRLSQVFKGTIVTNGIKISIYHFGKYLKFSIKEVKADKRDLVDEFEDLTISNTFYEVTQKTKWILFKGQENNPIQENLMLKIGGLNEEIKEIRTIMDICIVQQKPIYRAVLLYGHPGTGKSMLADALAKVSGANNLYIRNETTSEDNVGEIFEKALNNSPTVLVIDDVDMICPKASKNSGSKNSMLRKFCEFFENLQTDEDAKVFVIATTSNMDKLDPSLLKPGRFEMKIEIPVPNPIARKDILKKLLGDIEHNLNEEDFSEISFCTHGFVGGDLKQLCNSARYHACSDYREIIEICDLKFGLTRVIPSAMREAQVEVSDVKWSDIGGQEELKFILQKAVEWPLKYPESLLNVAVPPPNTVLMYGPPGCSKTMIAKALATESRLNFLSIKGPESFSKWVGESEKAIRDVFKKARQVAPSIIFFDEIDAIGGERSSGSSSDVKDRVLTTLLTEMNGVSPLGNVIVLAATNRPDRIDKALLRHGRFSKKIYVPLPDDKTRTEIFKLHLNKIRVKVDSNIDVKKLVDSTRGYSGAEVMAVCFEAGLKALEEDIHCKEVKMEHFEIALKNVLPITTKESLKLYEEFGAARSFNQIS